MGRQLSAALALCLFNSIEGVFLGITTTTSGIKNAEHALSLEAYIE